MITNALSDKALPVYGDGKQQRDWLHVEDNCRGILSVLDKANRRGLQHWWIRSRRKPDVGPSHPQSNWETRHLSVLCAGPPGQIVVMLWIAKNRNRARLEPAISLEMASARTIDWYKSNLQWVAGVRSRDTFRITKSTNENRESSLRAIADPDQ